MAIPGRAPLRAAQLFFKWLDTELTKEEVTVERIKGARKPARKPGKR